MWAAGNGWYENVPVDEASESRVRSRFVSGKSDNVDKSQSLFCLWGKYNYSDM
jgi:hypothetical protein